LRCCCRTSASRRRIRDRTPRRAIFGELPKTSTGKTQKFLLRMQAKSATAIE
jgi:fatty-acyl-CoA synthase